jgi:hypothetical protein
VSVPAVGENASSEVEPDAVPVFVTETRTVVLVAAPPLS